LAAPRPNISTLAKVSSSSAAVSKGTNDDDELSSLSFVDDKIIVGAAADGRHTVGLVRAVAGVKARTDVSVANTSTVSTTSSAEQRILLAATIVLAVFFLLEVVAATILVF
jgi:hypothetical protein